MWEVMTLLMTKYLIYSLVAIIAASTISIATATYLEIVDAGVSPKNSQTTQLTITTTDDVPKRTTDLAGFAWLYENGPNTAFAITTHNADVDEDGKNDVRDSHQNPDGWHAHNVVLAGGTGQSTFCVTEIFDAPTSGISISGDSIKVNVRNSVLTGELSSTSAAFNIIVDQDCPITVPTTEVIDGGLPLGIVVTSTHP